MHPCTGTVAPAHRSILKRLQSSVRPVKASVTEIYMASKHSKEFLKILTARNVGKALKTKVQDYPVLVFRVNEDAMVIESPDPSDNKVPVRQLSGGAIFIGVRLYIVIYSGKNRGLSVRQRALLRRSYPGILAALVDKGVKQKAVENAIFINRMGKVLEV